MSSLPPPPPPPPPPRPSSGRKAGSQSSFDEEEYLAQLEEGGDVFASLRAPETNKGQAGGGNSLTPPSRNITSPQVGSRKRGGASSKNAPPSPPARYGSTQPAAGGPLNQLNSLVSIPEDAVGRADREQSSVILPSRLASRISGVSSSSSAAAVALNAPAHRSQRLRHTHRIASSVSSTGRPPQRPPSRQIPSLLSTRPGGASVVQGTKAIRLSVMPNVKHPYSSIAPSSEQQSRTTSFAPKRLLDIENGVSILVSDQRFLPSARYQELGKDGAIVVTERVDSPFTQGDAAFFDERGRSLRDQIHAKDIRAFEANNEVGILGGAWRGALKRLVMMSMDEVNALRLSRILQLFLPFQTGYEAYILGQLIESLDALRPKDIRYVLNVAFQNRNVSRILLQQMGPRFDFLWHWYTQITWNRGFDAWGQLPIVGFTSFPATENFPSTRDHALASIFRIALGEGNWITRVVTQNRQGLVTTNPDNTAQNLAAESNGFELANRNQFGTYVGRLKTNEFRFHHRLPTDESVVRTFVADPSPTLLNNGVVHVLRQLAKHWHNMLYQFSGNFAHQRQEQLNPFETLRFHMPVMLLTLASLRGRNKWDARVLGPMVRKLQQLKPSMTTESARALVRELQEHVASNVCAGVASVLDPFLDWLDAIYQACEYIEEEAQQVYRIVSSVEIGIRLGHDLITQVSWKIPKDAQLKRAVLDHIRGKQVKGVNERRIRSALALVTPRDKRTLIELVKNNLAKSKPAQLLLGRARTLLHRELRREILNETIREIAIGEQVHDVVRDEWYWLVERDGRKAVHRYDAKVTGRDKHRFVHVDTNIEKFVALSDESVKIYAYVPVAEAISRAQKAFMTIELDHGKKFAYDAFMEFTYLRTALRRLVVLAQIHCEELDNARLNVLAEIQRCRHHQVAIHNLVPGQTYFAYNGQKKSYDPFVCKKTYTSSDPEWDSLARTQIVKVPPQSIIVIGGGPTGLTATMHCLENCLVTGGVMKLFEARDAFQQGGATFERAQIVRLDSRWIAMLRYHLGTGFEDVYIPASGETDSQLGNTLPTQGFVEITIKDLENMLHVGVSKMWAKGLIQVHTDARSSYDPETNTLTKLGQYLKVDDAVLRRIDRDGRRSRDYHSWRVVKLEYTESLPLDQLKIGEEYGIYIRLDNAILPHKLMGVDLMTNTYTFMSLQNGRDDLKATATNLPSVYPKGTMRHAEVRNVVLECVEKNSAGTGYTQDQLRMTMIKKQKFTLDIGHTHVVEAIGKPHGSKVHFSVTTYEPYGVCCMQGLKVSMGMHNFGEKRWGSGLLDDVRSLNDQNTRIIGDFTKMVRSRPIVERMSRVISNEKDKNWQIHFAKLVEQSDYPQLMDMEFLQRIKNAVAELAEMGASFRRKTLQTRFFETGDNFYLGMEFPREYDRWKNALCEDLVKALLMAVNDNDPKAADKRKAIGKFKGLLMHHIDRLWYDSCLETIRTGDVYNPGARHRVPRLYLINSYSDTNLGKLPIGESFRLSDRPEEKYEVLLKGGQIVVRNVEGYISRMRKNTKVKVEGNLTRGPDGNRESKVAMATFPVGHYVNFRTMRLNDSEKGYVFAFIGDEQSTPHFMRYSGLTGACINAMLFNNFIKQAADGISFIDRFKLYSIETNWSNGEVVQRGTGANYGLDGFLRPGFSYSHGLDYLHSKVIEYRESDQDLDNILSRDWKVKMAASMVPRGMELNEKFIKALLKQVRDAVFEKFITEVTNDKAIDTDAVVPTLRARYESMAYERANQDYKGFWDEFLTTLTGVDDRVKQTLEDPHVFIARRLDQLCNQIIEFAGQLYTQNARISSELFNQPKAVDSIVDDFAVEAQNFANSLTQSAAFSSGALAFTLLATGVGNVFGAVVAALNIFISFGTMTNVSRYKIRNEEARIIFKDEKLQGVIKSVFSVMDRSTQDSYPVEMNPFVEHLEEQVAVFYENAKYYDLQSTAGFTAAYDRLKSNINEPAAVSEFMDALVTKFIVDDFHENSYVQQYLVNIYKTCYDMHRLLTEDVNRKTSSSEAKALFDRLHRFRSKLENSLQRGPVRWGFLKKRRFDQWDISVTLKYILSFFCFSTRAGSLPGAPISIETLGIARQARHLSGLHQSTILRREIRDLEGLFWATRESDIASLIFMAGYSVFLVSIVFTIARIFGIRILTNIAFWATLASSFGAILALNHLVRKFFILLRLHSILGNKVRNWQSTDTADNIRKVRRVTWTQIVLTFARLLAAGAASVALPWSIAENQFGGQIQLGERIPFWIALGAVATALASTLFFFIVEYVVRYNLSPKLGEFVCESFRDEIENMYHVLSKPVNDIDTKQVQERQTWEYVAREFLHRYRFDAVFAADRFGSILQYIQGGMDPRN